MTILKPKNKYSISILEAASKIIISKRITLLYKNFKTVLDNIQDEKNVNIKESNYNILIRGGKYFGEKDNVIKIMKN